jgi:hypothetical protein
MSPLVGYSMISNYYFNVDLPILMDYMKYNSTTSYYNILFFNLIFKKGTFFSIFFFKTILLNFEVFFFKRNILFDQKFYFFKTIKFIFNNAKYLNVDVLN